MTVVRTLHLKERILGASLSNCAGSDDAGTLARCTAGQGLSIGRVTREAMAMLDFSSRWVRPRGGV